jgi:hypothetical protein
LKLYENAFDFLSLADLQVQIVGQRDMYVKEGSTLNLTCTIISGGVNEASSSKIMWTKDGAEIDLHNSPARWAKVVQQQESANEAHSRHQTGKLAALRRYRHLGNEAAAADQQHSSNYRRTRALASPTLLQSTSNPPSVSPVDMASIPIIVNKPRLSRLIVLKASKRDSGVYQCVPPHGEPSRVFVHVIQG